MPRRPRSVPGTPFFHVINRSVRREPLFVRPRDYRAFLAVLGEGLRRYPIRLLAYCIMSNHWHLVVGPARPKDLSKLMHWVTATHAIRWHRHRKTAGQGPVYQGRYKCQVITELDRLMRACRYVERNALRAGLVRRSQDWPWGSLSERLRPALKLPLVSTAFLCSDAWVGYVNAPAPQDPGPVRRPGTENTKTVENRPDPLDLDDGAEVPGAGGAERRQRRVGVGRRDHEDQTHAHVERAKHLRLFDSARLRQPREDRRNGPTLAIK
jgi:REP-associated tyrosine transposase